MAFVIDNSVVSGWYLVNVACIAVARRILSEKDARLSVSYILGLPISIERSAVAAEKSGVGLLRP